MSTFKKSLRWAVVPALLTALFASSAVTAPATAATAGLPDKIRIGYFANVTHAPALIAAQKNLWKKYLPGVTIEPFIFGAGPAAIEALKGNALDVSYIGPNPAIAGYNTTNGTLLRIVSGATSGGAQFITKTSINSVADLKGKNFASPGLGGTQDVALKNYLKDNGLVLGKDVTVTPTENSTTLALFQKGEIDGAWVPEPWASRLVIDGKGKVFVDEKTLWKGGKFTTTNIIAGTSFLKKYPKAVTAIIKANIDAIAFIKKSPAEAKDLVQAELLKQTGKKLSDDVIARAWPNLTFTNDPLAETLKKNADQAVDAGLLSLRSLGIRTIYDLTLLNKELKAQKLKTVSAAGNGKQ